MVNFSISAALFVVIYVTELNVYDFPQVKINLKSAGKWITGKNSNKFTSEYVGNKILKNYLFFTIYLDEAQHVWYAKNVHSKVKTVIQNLNTFILSNTINTLPTYLHNPHIFQDNQLTNRWNV